MARSVICRLMIGAWAVGLAAGSAHASESSTLTVLKSRMILPLDQSVQTCSVLARSDAVILSFYTDNTPTVTDNTNARGFLIQDMRIAGSPISQGAFPCIVGDGGGTGANRDMMRNVSLNCTKGAGNFNPIPLAKGETFEVDLNANLSDNDVVLDVAFAVQSSSKPKLTGACSPTDDRYRKSRNRSKH